MAEPAYSFTIPSLEDDTVLDARIYHPLSLSSALPGSPSGLKGAIVAHPYAPLGGSYDDHVVLFVTETLLQRGHVVATFNFRYEDSWLGRERIYNGRYVTNI